MVVTLLITSMMVIVMMKVMLKNVVGIVENAVEITRIRITVKFATVSIQIINFVNLKKYLILLIKKNIIMNLVVHILQVNAIKVKSILK